MSDVTTGLPIPVPPEATSSLAALEKQIAGIEAMIPGAKQAGLDTTSMEQTVAALKASIAALKGIPGVG